MGDVESDGDLDVLMLINTSWATEARETIRKLVSATCRPIPGNPYGAMIHATLQFGRSFSEDRAKEIAFSLLDGVPSGSWSFKRWYDGTWNIESTADSVIRPRRARLSARYSDIELPLTDEQKDKSVRFRRLGPGFASIYGDDKARSVNVHRLHTYASDQSLAVVIPTDAPQEVVARMRLGGDGAAVSREGLLLPQHFKTGLPLSPVRAR